MTVPEPHAVQTCPTLAVAPLLAGRTRAGNDLEPSTQAAQTDHLYRIAAILTAALLLTTVL